MTTYRPYTLDEIITMAAVLALLLSREGAAAEPHWRERLQELVRQITGSGAPGTCPQAEEGRPRGRDYPGVFSDRIISLEDGRAYAQLYTHLRERGLGPDSYRHKWGLPEDYPMMADDEKARRESVARQHPCQRRRRGRPRKHRD